MSMENCLPITIGTLLKHALKAQLQSIGSNLRILRQARSEDIATVARSVGYRRPS